MTDIYDLADDEAHWLTRLLQSRPRNGSVPIRFAIAAALTIILHIGLVGCGGNSQQQIADERAQIEASIAAAEKVERERDEQVKRDAAAIVAAHDAAERDENAKAQAAAAEQEKPEEAAAGR